MKWKPTDAPNVSFMYYSENILFILFLDEQIQNVKGGTDL